MRIKKTENTVNGYVQTFAQVDMTLQKVLNIYLGKTKQNLSPFERLFVSQVKYYMTLFVYIEYEAN